MTQNDAMEILKMGHNAFITGPAGSGKTYVLNQYIKFLQEKGVDIGITASTGIAATHMGGVTIHSWSGIGIKDKLSENDIDELEQRSYLWKRMENAKVLIIDEISMLHHFRLDLIESVIRGFKRNDKQFGGMQVIFCGDFFQLPPVNREGEEKAKFAYHSNIWKKLDIKICYLEEQHRQNDREYLEVLNAIRDNNISEKVLGHLKSRHNKKTDLNIEPTRLHSHNVDVDSENERELAKIDGKVFEYEVYSKGNPNLVEVLKKSCMAPAILKLKIGAKVMFVKNNFEAGYANGSLGVVIACDEPFSYEPKITVKLLNGKIVNVEPASWRIEDGGKVKAEIVQYPLRLAWAITVHKSQGMSLDCAEIDLKKAFEKGMGYVALSRVKSLSGLCISGWNDTALCVSEEALEMDAECRNLSDDALSEYKKMPKSEVREIQNDFLNKISPVGGKKIKRAKISTVDITKGFVLEGKTIYEIARERELTVDTILGHIEKAKDKDPKIDLEHLKKDLKPVLLKKIISVFKKIGMSEGGYYSIAKAKEILGESATYEEIRLARLFI